MATKNYSTIGLKDLTIAPLTKDDETGVTYGTVETVSGAINVQLSNDNNDPDIQYADDIEYDVLNLDPDISMTVETTDLPLSVQEEIFGSTIDKNGVLVKKSTDTSPYFAVGFKSEKSDHTYRYVWLFKCRATPSDEEYNTKEGDTITRQTGSVEFTAIKRTYDNAYQAVADEGLNGFTTTKAATFLTEVYTPEYESES